MSFIKDLRNKSWKKSLLFSFIPTFHYFILDENFPIKFNFSDNTKTLVYSTLILALIIIILFISHQIFTAIQRGVMVLIQFVILLITILSLFAFGLEEVPIEGTSKVIYEWNLKIPELSAVIVLFFLSELAVGLTNQAYRIRRDTGRVQQNVQNILAQMEKSKFVETVAGLPMSEVAANFFKLIKDPQVATEVQNKMTEYFKAWHEIFEKLINKEASEKKIKITYWLLESYVDEEILDLLEGNKFRISKEEEFLPLEREKQYDIPTMATNEVFYLKLLHNLASNMVEEYSDEYKICFLALTVVTPEHWYNWKHNDEEYALKAHNDFRNIVKRIISTHSDKIEYERYVLLDSGKSYKHRGIEKSSTCLENQKSRVFITIDPDDKELEKGDAPYEYLEILKEIVNMEGLNLALPDSRPGDPKKYVYFIINSDEIPKLGFSNNDYRNYHNRTKRYKKDGIDVSLKAQNLVLKFINELHSDSELAYYAKLREGELEKLFPMRDQDLLMIGLKSSSDDEPKWLTSVSTDLVPGYKTMQMRITMEKEVLEYTYYASRKLKSERWIDIID